MSNKIKYTILLIIILSCVSCSSNIKSRSIGYNKSKSKTFKVQSQDYKSKAELTNYSSIKDTTFIYLSKAEGNNNDNYNLNIDDLYSNALNKFNNSDYHKSANEFKLFIDACNNKNEKYYQAMFYYAESLRQINSTKDAIDVINQYINNKGIPENVLQPSLVLLGQCYCERNQLNKAQESFDRLKREYPDSKYNKIANCD